MIPLEVNGEFKYIEGITRYEEAGVKGTISSISLGIFTYNKRLCNGAARPATVEVYAMCVEKELKNGPNKRSGALNGCQSQRRSGR